MSTMVNVFNVATSTRTETVSQTTVTNIFPVVVAVTSTQTNPVVSVNENSQTTIYQTNNPDQTTVWIWVGIAIVLAAASVVIILVVDYSNKHPQPYSSEPMVMYPTQPPAQVLGPYPFPPVGPVPQPMNK